MYQNKNSKKSTRIIDLVFCFLQLSLAIAFSGFGVVASESHYSDMPGSLPFNKVRAISTLKQTSLFNNV